MDAWSQLKRVWQRQLNCPNHRVMQCFSWSWHALDSVVWQPSIKKVETWAPFQDMASAKLDLSSLKAEYVGRGVFIASCFLLANLAMRAGRFWLTQRARPIYGLTLISLALLVRINELCQIYFTGDSNTLAWNKNSLHLRLVTCNQDNNHKNMHMLGSRDQYKCQMSGW